MMINARTAAQDARRRQALEAWEHVLHEVLGGGFYGTAAVEISVQDGALQLIRRRIEQIERPLAVVAQHGPSAPRAAPRAACRAATSSGTCRG